MLLLLPNQLLPFPNQLLPFPNQVLRLANQVPLLCCSSLATAPLSIFCTAAERAVAGEVELDPRAGRAEGGPPCPAGLGRPCCIRWCAER